MLDYDALAQQVLDVSLRVKPGERVWISTWNFDIELASQLAWQCVKRRCQVFSTVQYEDLWNRLILEAPVELIDSLPDHQAAALRETDVYIFTLGPSMIEWDIIPADRRKLVTFWFLEQNRYVEQWKNIAKKHGVRMLGIEATMATPQRAKRLGLNYQEWRQIMFEGCLTDFEEISRRAGKLAKIMAGNARVHVTTPHGTDFTFDLDNRRPDSFDGILRDDWIAQGRPAFLPAGGIEVSADENSAHGRIVFDAPILSLLSEGRIEGLTLTVSNGRIMKVSASSQKIAFEKWLRDGTGDVDRFGFFGFGLNPKLRHGYGQDDKVLGGVTIGFGDNTDKAGHNKANRGFWASMTKTTVTIDEKYVMREGRLLIH